VLLSSARTSAWGDSEQAPGVEQLYCDASDVALLYRLALEKAKPGTIYHAVNE
jgi:hypothetical protein